MNPSNEAILAARYWFASNCYACIAQAMNGTFEVNDLTMYKATQTKSADDYLSGKFDKTFTLLQRAWYIQTGESVPLLPHYLNDY